eukprot:Colp12_sorted_trinity150504_noHs@31060
MFAQTYPPPGYGGYGGGYGHQPPGGYGPSPPGYYPPNPNQHTRVTYTRNASYPERVGSSCCAIFFGLGLFFASFFVLFLNEGRAVHTAALLDEGLALVQPVDSLYDKPSAYNGRSFIFQDPFQ